MRRSHSRAGVLLAVTVMTAATAACTASSDDTSGGPSVLRVSLPTPPTSIDPAQSCTPEDLQLTASLYTRLLQFGSKEGPDGTSQIDWTQVDPYLAKSWTASEDGLTYTFTLDSGWEFPSGEPMDAEAVAYSLNRSLKMNQCAAVTLNDLYTDPNLIKSVTAPDATQVVIELTKPDPQILLALADPSSSIVDPSLIEANGGVVEGKPNEWMDSHSAGGGAFVLESYVPSTSAVLVANPTYRGPAPRSEEINITWSSSPSTQLVNVQNGSTDIAYGLTGASLESLKSSEDVRVVTYDDITSMEMLMPNDKAPWTDRDVREAVVRALPYEEIINNVVNGLGVAYYGPIPPTMQGYSEEYSEPIAQDLDAAKRLIEESGVETPIPVTLDILAGDNNQAAIATVVQSTLKEIGFDIKVRTLSSSAWNDAIYSGKSQSALRVDGPAYANTGYYLQYDMDCASLYNTGHICVPANTDLLKQARATADPAEVDRLYAEISKNWVAEYPRVTLYQLRTPFALSDSVAHFYSAGSGSLDMREWGKS